MSITPVNRDEPGRDRMVGAPPFRRWFLAKLRRHAVLFVLLALAGGWSAIARYSAMVEAQYRLDRGIAAALFGQEYLLENVL